MILDATVKTNSTTNFTVNMKSRDVVFDNLATVILETEFMKWYEGG